MWIVTCSSARMEQEMSWDSYMVRLHGLAEGVHENNDAENTQQEPHQLQWRMHCHKECQADGYKQGADGHRQRA